MTDELVKRLTLAPRGLSREEAARYVGIGPTLFDQLVEQGKMPKPARIGRRAIWDRYKLDAAFADLDDGAAENRVDRALRMIQPGR